MLENAYYNEIETYPAHWLENLISAGHIAPGRVDRRDIREVKPDDIQATQAHFFAGIGVWSYALRLAGWSDDRPVWTGSCPCQPFSTAGKRGGTDDPRHLWPEWYRLIGECGPAVIFGEQVASKDGLAWLDLVYADLESAGYSVAAFDLCAAGVGAPHIRQRIYFVADTYGHNNGSRPRNGDSQKEEIISHNRGTPRACFAARDCGETGILGDPNRGRREQRDQGERSVSELDKTGGFWSDIEWLPCRDGKLRPTKPGIFPLAHGAAGRVGRLRAYGNAIVAPLAAEFIKAYMEVDRSAQG